MFAAASLKDAFTEAAAAFEEANPDAKVTLNFGASSALAQQIDEKAPADVFASADQANMQKVVDAGGISGTPEVFATNSLEIIVAPGNPEGITGLADLAAVRPHLRDGRARGADREVRRPGPREGRRDRPPEQPGGRREGRRHQGHLG